MKFSITILLVWSCIYLSCALPVTKKKTDEKEETSTPETLDVESALEYERYLKEVVAVLETDPEFRKKLDKAPQADIRNGKIAQELEYVNHKVRTKLDEIKRRELDRLKELAKKEFELKNRIDRNHLKINQHLDHTNELTFEIKDLEKLIKKTAEDLAEADRKRQAEFKQYEMQKEFEKNMVKQELNEDQRKKFEKEQEELERKHKQHEKIHHPGKKAQLEEVWEKQDHMDVQDFNPKIFFMTHDVNGDGFWDEDEVKALFVKELDKVYQSGLPEDDMRERAEEMERMREQLFKETDINRDDLISLDEFIEQTKREEFNKDPEWHTIDEQPQYTHEEYLKYERERKEEIDRKIAQGLLSPHPNMPQEYQQQQQMHYQNPQQQHMQQQQQYQQQQQQYQQQQYQQQQQHYQQQQYQHQEKQVLLNSNQVYQQIPVQPQQMNYQQQPQLVNSMPPQQQQQPIVNNLPPQQQPVAKNSGTQLQPDANNIPHQDPPLGTNNISQQQQQINGVPHQPINNVQHQQNYIPQKH